MYSRVDISLHNPKMFWGRLFFSFFKNILSDFSPDIVDSDIVFEKLSKTSSKQKTSNDKTSPNKLLSTL